MRLVGLVIGLGSGCAAFAAQPNILIIQTDQHRNDCMEMTSGNVRTPSLRKLSREGITFTNTHSPIPTSCPARQTLLTGMWPERHGGLWNWDITLPAPEFRGDTWTEKLQQKGYVSGYVGKWHVHPSKNPKDYGFADYVQEWGPYENWRKENNLPDVHRMKDGPYFGGYDPVSKDSSKTHWMADRAIELIAQYASQSKPWHVRLDLAEPHLPCFPAKEYYDKYDPDKIEMWGNFKDDFKNKPYIQRQQLVNWGVDNYTWDQWKHYVRRYLAMIEQTDDAVGRVLDFVKSQGLDENTIIIYTSDHGDAAGSHGMVDKHYVMYDEVVRVPLIVKWKGVVKAGTSCDNFVMNGLDLAATMCDIASLDLKTQGSSLLPLLKGENPASWRKYAFSNYNGQQFGLYVQRMIRDAKMKYVWNLTDVDELYDLQKDPNELHNLINDALYSAELKTLRKELFNDLQRRDDPLVRQESAKRQLLEGKKL